MEHLRDSALGFYTGLLQSKWKGHTKIQASLAAMDAHQQLLLKQCLTLAVDHALHDFLFQVDVNADHYMNSNTVNDHERQLIKDHDEKTLAGHIQIVVDEKVIALVSDGLQGELFGKEGWIEKYSQFEVADNLS